ncbi:MAG: DUF2116 family Zn-ribbon domain-containing protein [Aigarchaeota archaeon]|nr:DUF2116 family Zn-ribbon domain-containing protein [Aigarchaeota archaeon]MCX8192549.1 DUF2116 family Zn-ribbon domain-containing protein [Nitrososphaeria archaeon]MDW7985715.1 DUF2116 family Zn-ribbon domain-containing protein [Nitrososphaerota archaeon]
MSHKKFERPKIVDHRHCKICARAIPPDEEFCSDKCRQVFEDYKKKEKRGRLLFYVIYGILMVALLMLFILRPMTSS